MKIQKVLLGGLVACLFTLTACRPGGAEYIDELDIVGTAYSKEADFKAKLTYARPDSIVEIGTDDVYDPDGNGRPDYINQSSANIIINQLDANMQAYGWTKVDRSANPDVIVMLSAMSTTNIYYYYSGWYGGAWGYPYYGGGWYYPGYYPPTYSTTTTGTLLMQMADVKDTTVNGNAPILWLGVVNGMLNGGSSSFAGRAKKSVDQAFKQSPILKK
jgi:hypothetical protein